MIASEVFIRHAAECEYMSKRSRDPENRAVWRSMAERWIRCAELAQHHSQPSAKTRAHGKPANAYSLRAADVLAQAGQGRSCRPLSKAAGATATRGSNRLFNKSADRITAEQRFSLQGRTYDHASKKD
jgi:DNA modification methylase